MYCTIYYFVPIIYFTVCVHALGECFDKKNPHANNTWNELNIPCVFCLHSEDAPNPCSHTLECSKHANNASIMPSPQVAAP